MSYFKNISVVSCFFFYSFAIGQKYTDSIKSLNEVTIQSFKHKTTIQQLPYAVQIIKKNELQQNNARTLPESMMHLPGVMIQKSTHGGGSPFIRGLTGNQTLIVLDGIRLNNAIFRYGPNQYMNLVEPDIVEKIEVLKGSGAVQYGSDALTGAIHMETNELSFKDNHTWNAKLNTRYTNKNMEKSTRPSIGYESKFFSIQASSSFKEFGDIYGGGTIKKQSPSGYNETGHHLKTMIQLGKGWILKSLYQTLKQPEVPVFYKYIYENFKLNTSTPIHRSLGYIQVFKKFKSNYFDELKLFASKQQIEERRKLQKNGSTLLRIEEDTDRTLGIGGELKNKWTTHWITTTGFDYYNDLINSSRIDQSTSDGNIKSLRGLYPDGAKYNSFSIYHLHHIRWNRFQLEAGGRYNHYKAVIQDTTLGNIKIQPNALIFQLGGSVELIKNIYLYSNISEGFRAPNIDDLGTLGIVDFRYEKPNYNLQPEKSLNTEIGLKFYNKTFHIEASAFRTSLKNLITRIKTNQNINGYDVYEKENVDKGYIKGLEFNTSVSPTKNLLIRGNFTYLYGQSVTRNEPLRRIPPLTTNLISTYSFSKHEAGMIYTHADPQHRLAQGDKDDIRIGKNGTPGFNVVSFYSKFNFKHFSSQFYLNNVTNTVYKTHGSGIYEMGRSITISLTFYL